MRRLLSVVFRQMIERAGAVQHPNRPSGRGDEITPHKQNLLFLLGTAEKFTTPHTFTNPCLRG
jgi:hypothetical protein